MATKSPNGKADEIIIDLNGISRADFRAWFQGREKAQSPDAYDAEHLYPKIIVSWPWDEPITPEGYDRLGNLDAMRVDREVSAALEQMAQKK